MLLPAGPVVGRRTTTSIPTNRRSCSKPCNSSSSEFAPRTRTHPGCKSWDKKACSEDPAFWPPESCQSPACHPSRSTPYLRSTADVADPPRHKHLQYIQANAALQNAQIEMTSLQDALRAGGGGGGGLAEKVRRFFRVSGSKSCSPRDPNPIS